MISFDHLVTDPSNALVREAQQHSVTALEWNKHRLFSGFSSGKVLMTTVKLNKVISSQIVYVFVLYLTCKYLI